MIIFKRKIPLTKILPKTIGLLKILIHAFIYFKYPLKYFFAYFKKSSNINEVIFRSGMVIKITNPADLITVIVVFCKKDYGIIDKGSIVIDIGANIGVFTLYAAICQAEKIYAFEPNKAAYDLLCENIKFNQIENKVKLFNIAVWNKDNDYIFIPKESSPYNKSLDVVAEQEKYDKIRTQTLKTIFEENNVNNVNLLKLDCEGAEFKIIPELDTTYYNFIDQIKLECHGDPNILEKSLKNFNFKKYHQDKDILWFKKTRNK